ncbi:MAG: 4Fe-4S dicluster domain-containing protein, partial [Clostridia bacterium]|nr:4Fe-4S dicluster domain-containing protein [Clostridia bacterium]
GGCSGHLDIDKIKSQGVSGITNVIDNDNNIIINSIYGESKIEKASVLLSKCQSCKGAELKIADEIIGEGISTPTCDERFDGVKKLEAMTAEQRFAFWKSELSKCIRCNACRNICPACTCRTCVFDNARSNVAAKANATEFEEKMFHIIRAFHVAGRCTDCGECSRVCPQSIPLHLLNRKFIKDINEFYGDYQAGEEANQRNPLVNFTEGDIEATVISDKEGK